MAGAIVQSAVNIDDSGGNSTTIAVTINGVIAGNHLVVHIGYSDAGAINVSGVNDGAAYAEADPERRDVGINQSGTVWYLENSSGGNKTVTATFNSTTAFRRIRVSEVSGLLTSGSIDKTIGQSQTDPGTGANAVSSSASAATTNANDFVMGFTQACDSTSPGSGTLSAGTGYTISGSNLIMGLESKSVSATGAQTATFTTSLATENYISHMVAFKEITAPGPAATVIRFARPSNLRRIFDAGSRGFRELLTGAQWW